MAHSATNNFSPPDTPSRKSDAGDRNSQHASDFPLSLALMPAGLEVVSATEHDKKVEQDEKELVQAEKEVVQAEKEVAWLGILPDGWHVPWRGPEMSRTLCGLKVTVFRSLLVSLLAIIALGIGLGVGLGIDLKGNRSLDDESNSAVPITVCIIL